MGQFRLRTVTSVAQVGPDDVFLGEAEDAESAASHRGVDHNAGVRYHVHPFKQLHPETQKSCRFQSLRPQQEAAAGSRKNRKRFPS